MDQDAIKEEKAIKTATTAIKNCKLAQDRCKTKIFWEKTLKRKPQMVQTYGKKANPNSVEGSRIGSVK